MLLKLGAWPGCPCPLPLRCLHSLWCPPSSPHTPPPAYQVLDGLEPVRKRPGMYIGSTGSRGLHHLVYEVLDNCIDEVQAGHASNVDVELDLGSGWVCIADDGRGIPTGVHPRTGEALRGCLPQNRSLFLPCPPPHRTAQLPP
eukprot:365721-Chlamydomonas_euryale.AAC.20